MQKKLLCLLSCLTLQACSVVNSVAPFDRTQAAHLLQQNNYSVHGKMLLDLSLPNQNHWKKIKIESYSIVLIPIDETIELWNERIDTNAISFLQDPHLTAKQLAKRSMEISTNQCQIIHSVILEDHIDSTTYLMHLQHCQDQFDQLIIGKTFNGKDGVYSVKYIALDTVPRAEVMQTQKAIQHSQLVEN